MTEERDAERLLHNLLAEGGECKWLEFKENYGNPQEIGEYLSALSNSALLHGKDYGYLVFGIQDKSFEIVGTNFSPKKEKKGDEELENWLSRGLKPPTHFRQYEFICEGKSIVLFKVEASLGTPVAFYGEEFVRKGSYKKKLKDHPEEEEKIWKKRKSKSFEKGVALGSLTKDIYEMLNCAKYFQLMGIPMPSEKSAVLDKLEEDGIIFREGESISITNLGAILFAVNLRDFKNVWRKALRVIRYEGVSKVAPAREKEMSSGYASGFDEFITYINAFLPIREVIKNGFRKEIRDYPEIAVRELLANMLIHQDFEATGTGPMVEIFNDRIEFSNPGNSLIDAKRFIDHRPKSRNETLADIMRRMNICEERGVGIDKVIMEVENYHLPAPKFVSEPSFCITTLFGPRKWKDMTRTDKLEACYQHCCLRHLSGSPMTDSSLRERFGLTESDGATISGIISDAVDAKFIRSSSDAGKSLKMACYLPFWA